jgi:ketosteroid isomerase-like protein
MGAVRVSRQAPVDLVASWVAAFNERDLDGMLACLDPKVDFHPVRLTGLDRSYRGHDGVRRWYEQLGQLGHEYVVDVEHLGSDPAGTVVTVAGSLNLEQAALAPFTAVHTIAGGRVLTARHYLSELDLVEHVGLIGDTTIRASQYRPGTLERGRAKSTLVRGPRERGGARRNGAV